jgi:hypothetical protein
VAVHQPLRVFLVSLSDTNRRIEYSPACPSDSEGGGVDGLDTLGKHVFMREPYNGRVLVSSMTPPLYIRNLLPRMIFFQQKMDAK